MDKEVSLTLRTGAGTQYRIIGSLTTGDVATILTRGDGWTKVRTAEGKEGWVSAGFLQASPPARIQLERLERNTEELRRQVAELSEKTADLRTTKDEDREQRRNTATRDRSAHPREFRTPSGRPLARMDHGRRNRPRRNGAGRAAGPKRRPPKTTARSPLKAGNPPRNRAFAINSLTIPGDPVNWAPASGTQRTTRLVCAGSAQRTTQQVCAVIRNHPAGLRGQ